MFTILIDRLVKNKKETNLIMARTPKIVEDRREQIIEAAMRAFAQKGFARTSNRDVANEAGITTGLIYYYFENKEALLRAVLEAYSPVQIVTQITPEMLEQPPEILLPFVLKRVLDIVEGEQFVSTIRVILPELLHNMEIAPIATSFLQRVVDFLKSYLEIQTTRGMLREDIDGELACQTLVCSMMGFVVRRQIFRDSSVQGYTHEEIARAVVETFLHGLESRT